MHPGTKNRIEVIESWFRANEDGEFVAHPSESRTVVVGDQNAARTIVYTTKPHCLHQFRHGVEFQLPCLILGRYGLPLRDDLPLLQWSPIPLNRIFYGDADPPDIMVFSWLREHVPITWGGVNDDVLVRYGNLDNARIGVRLSNSELAAISILTTICPDFRELLGKTCSSLLDNGYKIELEGAIIDDAPK